MATSLAQQLKKLAAPQTTLLLQDKIRPSLLFDPKEAAELDRDTVYAIGCTGLEELINIQKKFAQFEETLFDLSSKNLERAVLSREVNQKLDKSITKFLRLLSPYFLLRPAHKALEWLIHRFHIHSYNVDEYLALILPYHETKIFVRALQLLDLSEETGRWHWLEPLQKPGIPLPKSTLFTHCYKDIAFMKFVCKTVQDVYEVYGNDTSLLRMVVSFYTSTIIGALEATPSVSELHISTLVAHLLDGSSTPVKDYRAATYMIICQIYRKTTIVPSVSKVLLNSIATNLIPSLLREAILCLLVICQNQRITIDNGIIESFCKMPQIVEMLALLANDFVISPLLHPLLETLVAMDGNYEKTDENEKTRMTPSDLLNMIVQELPLTQEDVFFVVQQAVDKFLANTEDSNLQLHIGSLLNILGKRFAEPFDRSIEMSFQHCPSKKQNHLHNLLNSTMPSLKHKILPECNSSMFLSLNHASTAIRSMAVRVFVSKVKEKEGLEEQFVHDSILARLQDDDPSITQEILSLSEELFNFVRPEELFPLFTALLAKNNEQYNEEWIYVKNDVLSLLCSEKFFTGSEDQTYYDFLVTILPYLFPLCNTSTKATHMILESSLAKNNPFLKGASEGCLGKEGSQDCDRLAYYILMTLSDNILQMEKDSREDLILKFFKGRGEDSLLSRFVVCCLLHLVLPKINSPKLKVALSKLVIDHCKAVFSSIKVKYTDTNLEDNLELADLIVRCIDILQRKKFPDMVLVLMLRSVIQANTRSGSASNTLWWYYESDGNQDLSLKQQMNYIQIEVFNIISSHAVNRKSFRKLLNEFFKEQLQDEASKARFFCCLWTLPLADGTNECFDTQTLVIMQARALKLGITALTDVKNVKEIVLPSVLIAMISPFESIRRLALDFVETLSEREKNNTRAITKPILKYKEEILADPDQLPQVLKRYFEKATSPAKNNKFSEFIDHILMLISEKATPHHIKRGLLTVLKDTNSNRVLMQLIPLLTSELSHEETYHLTPNEGFCIQLILEKFTPSLANLLQLEKMAFEALKCALKSKIVVQGGNHVQQMALGVVSKEFFREIKSEKVKSQIIEVLLDACLDATSAVLKRDLMSAVRKLLRDGCLIAEQLSFIDAPGPVVTIRELRKKRLMHSTSKGGKDLEAKEWRRVILLLEIVQSKKHTTNNPDAIQACFKVLKLSLDLDSSPHTEYLRQVILSCLLNFCRQLQPKKPELDAEQFRVELIVQCIRVSHNPQTHNHALLLLNTAAVLFPDHILHNVMAIFTFMGTSLVKQDDHYSFQIIIETVQTIIPALLQASTENQQEVVRSLLLVFVDALPDIPEHRRLPLFFTLLSTLGVEDYLWLCVHLILENCIAHSSLQGSPSRQITPGSLPPLADFATRLVHKFPPTNQLLTLLKITEVLLKFPILTGEQSPKIPTLEHKLSNPVLQHLKRLSGMELHNLASLIIDSVTAVISSQVYIAQVANLDEEQTKALDSFYQKLIESVLQCIETVAHTREEENVTSEEHLKFWRTFLQCLYNLLDKVNSLLTSNHFLLVIAGLVHHPSSTVKRKAMEMLNVKLLNQPGFFLEEDETQLLQLLKPLMKIAKSGLHAPDEEDEEKQEEAFINRQTSLLSLKLLTKRLGTKYQQDFQGVLQMIIKFLRNNVQPYLLSTALLCLAELCVSLRAYVIPYLPKFMPPLSHLLEDMQVPESNVLLLSSLVTTIRKITNTLPSFLSPYMNTILKQTCILSVSVTERGGSLAQQLSIIRSSLATNILPRVLIPAIETCFTAVLVKHEAVGPLMSVLNTALEQIEKSELNAHLGQLQAFFLNALNIRNYLPQAPLQELHQLEEHILNPFLTLVLKLSETTFRPLFYKIYEWATRQEEPRERVLTFYHLTQRIAEKLKSLFVLFAPHFLKNAAELLDQNNKAKIDDDFFDDDQKSSQLLTYILNTLNQCFVFDREQFFNKERFNTLMQPLVDQIENKIGGDDAYKERVNTCLSPSIAHFTVAIGNDSMWKPLHYQILLKTRHSDVMVRYASLDVLSAMAEKLSKDYMVLFPEAVPFLAELMEDENFEIEERCQNLIAELEKILGEPLSKYF